MLRVLALAATAALAITGAAQAAPVVSSHFSSDAAFLSYLSGRGVTLPANEIFVAQARSGNNAGNGDYEAGLHTPTQFTNGAPVGTPGQFAWGSAGGNNGFIDFTLTRTGNSISFAIGNYNQTWTNALVGTLDGLGFRARSEGAGNSTQVRDIEVNGQALPTAALTAANGGLDFVVIEGLSGDFILTGEASLNWASGAFPSGSRLGFQIKGLDVPVPEPASALLLLSGVAGLALLRRRRPA